jgi:tetratricopeptide (TPR) repeat protein
MIADQTTVSGAVNLVESARVLVPGLGRVDVSEAEIAALADIAGVAIAPEAIPAPALVVCSTPQRALLYLGEGLPTRVRVFLALRAIGRFWPGSGTRSLEQADVFALCGALPHSGRVRGAAWQVPAVRELAEARVWNGSSLRRLLNLCEAANASLDPPMFSDAAVSVMAVEALARGFAARAAGQHREAIQAFDEAAVLAREAGSWEVLTRAVIATGVAHKYRGRLREARRALREGLRASKRHELPDLRAMALHEMFSLAVDAGAAEQARRIAPTAFRAYRPDHPLLPQLVHDVADFWITEGQFAAALPVVRETVLHAATTAAALTGWGSVARAAGGAGCLADFVAAAEQVERLVIAEGAAEARSQALLDAARGASMLGRLAQAMSLGRRALVSASERGEFRLQFEAEGFLASVCGEIELDSPSERLDPTEKKHPPLAAGMIAVLQKRRMQKV